MHVNINRDKAAYFGVSLSDIDRTIRTCVNRTVVDYTNKLIAEGKSLDDTIHISCKTRFTPIILTALTTVDGLLPLTPGEGTL